MATAILRLPEVKARTGLSRSTIYLRISEGSFPSSVSLGSRAVGWIEDEVNDWLNKRLHRTEFMPFAPVTRIADADRLYQGTGGATHTAEFMTITFDCSRELSEKCPAVVHVDGTCRPQSIAREDNALYYDILDAFHRETGVPVLLNTSFNVRGEPIVNRPVDALRCYLGTGLDALVIGPFLLRKDRA